MAVTVTRTMLRSTNGIKTEKVQFDWVSDSGGAATSAATDLHGFLIKVVTDPGNSPTDNYDITLVADGVDMLGSALLDRDTTNSELAYPVISGATTPIFLAGSHVFTIANAGSTKSGIAYFYLREA